MRYLSTFSGIGGFELGIQLAYELLSKETEERMGAKNAESIRIQEGKTDNERDTRFI
jgi:hypothetical protein